MANTFAAITDAGHKEAQRIFMEALESHDRGMQWQALFSQFLSDRPSEVFEGLGTMPYLSAYDGETMVAIDSDDGFTATFTPAGYAGKRVQSVDKTNDVPVEVRSKLANMLASATSATVNTHVWDVFNNAFSGAHLGPDSKALCATDHPLKPGSGDTWSNKLTTALSKDAYFAAKATMGKQLDAEGKIIDIPMAQYLVVPTELEGLAKELTGADLLLYQMAASALMGSDFNPVKSDNIIPISSNYLSVEDANDWFLCTPPNDENGLKIVWRYLPEAKAGINEENDQTWMWSKVKLVAGWTSGRQVMGSEVA